MTITRWLSGVVLALAIGGCGNSDSPTNSSSGISPGSSSDSTEALAAPYRLLLDDRQIMNWVLDPAADVLWLSVGWVITEAGEENMVPTTDEGWDEVRNAAAMMAESGNLLMLPGRSKGADWNEFARAIISMGERAMAAAEARDEEPLFELGAQLYNVCVACHQLYMPRENL